MKRPQHLGQEIDWWLDYLDGREPTPLIAARFVLEVLADKTFTTRASCINAVGQWERERGNHPFASNPYPYPLLMRFLPLSFNEALNYVRGLEGADRATVAAWLLLKARSGDEVEVRENRAYVDGRVVPVTDEVAEWLAEYEPGHRGPLPPGVKVTDLHGALQHELVQRGVPEVTRAGLYGRWSAMKFAVADQPLTLFRCVHKVVE